MAPSGIFGVLPFSALLVLALSSGDASGDIELPSVNTNLKQVLLQEQQAFEGAKRSLGVLVAYNDKMRAELNNTEWANKEARGVQTRAAADLTAKRKDNRQDYAAKLKALVDVSVQETILKHNDSQFEQLRSQRASLMDAMSSDASDLEHLDDTYKKELMKADVCNAETARFSRAHVFGATAQNATADLMIFVGLADKLSAINGGALAHNVIAKQAPELKRRIEVEGASAHKLIVSLTTALVGRIDGVSGVCGSGKGNKREKKKNDKKNDSKNKNKKKGEEEKKKGKKGEDEKRHKKEKKGEKDKKGKHRKKSLMFLSQPTGLDIDSIAHAQGELAKNVQHNLGQMGEFLKAISKKLFNKSAAKAAVKSIEEVVASDLANKRAAILADIDAHMKNISQYNKAKVNLFSDVTKSKEYQSALAAVNKDMADIRQLDASGVDEPARAAQQSEDAEKDHVSTMVQALTKASDEMLADASAVQQLQNLQGMNKTKSAVEYTSVAHKSDRIKQVVQDVGGVSNTVIDTFYTMVKQDIADDVSRATSGVSTQPTDLAFIEARLASLLAVKPAWGMQACASAMLGLLLGTAVVVAMQKRRRSDVVNMQPLLG